MVNQTIQGFTLVELIMVIVIVGILASMTTDIITLPVKSYIALERRTTLVDMAETTLRRMQRDIRRALPNSIRITGGTSLELLHTSDGGRYRSKYMNVSEAISNPDYPGDILDFADSSDNTFDVMGSLSIAPTSNDKLVIYNTGSTSADAYVGTNMRDIVGTSTVGKVEFSPATSFPFSSPQQRFFIVDTPISYSCASNELRRYDNSIDASYSISSVAPTLASLSYKLQAKLNTISCNFSYDAGTAARAGLVTLEITLTDEEGESANLIHQVHVDNVP
jgi:MSHA biogenesis protein MshO